MPRKILLTEDDPFLIDIYTTKLKESGFQVELANNGEEAMRKLSDGQFDLLVLDLVLPHMDGWEVLRKIKSDKALRSLPVLVLSTGELSTKAQEMLAKELSSLTFKNI